MYTNGNEKAVAFAEAQLRQLEPRLRREHAELQEMYKELENMTPGPRNKASGKTNVDRHNEKLEKFVKTFNKGNLEFRELTVAVDKLKVPEDTWPELSEQDREILCRHYKAEVARLIGSKMVFRD